MFLCDITSLAWRKKKKVVCNSRIHLLMLVMILFSSVVCANETTFTANFKDTDLKSFVETVGANLNKTIVMGLVLKGE